MAERDAKNGTYVVPAPLVHKLIMAIFASLLAVAGYMAIWAIGDAAFKSEMRTILASQEEQLRRMNASVMGHLDGHPARIEDRVIGNQRRIERLEER